VLTSVSIKLVVLATFWQSVAISILTGTGVLPWGAYWAECFVTDM
jgi:hypothetical protein